MRGGHEAITIDELVAHLEREITQTEGLLASPLARGFSMRRRRAELEGELAAQRSLLDQVQRFRSRGFLVSLDRLWR